jgi:hypothetical protein
MKRFWSAMNRFWFSPEEPLNLGICRGLWFGFLAWEFRRADFGAWSTVPDFFWRPIWAFDADWIRPAPVAVMVVLQLVWKASLATSCVGFCTRTSTSLATILSFYLFGITQCFGKINHDTAVVPLISLILATSRCGDAFSIDALRSKVTISPSPEYRWPIRTVWVLPLAGLSCSRHR